MSRNFERVSCKVALYNPQHSKVLLVEYAPGDFGLPGGHIEENEDPEDATMRELREELGLNSVENLERCDFWRHTNGKIILGFIGELDESTPLKIDTNEIRSALWIELEKVRNGEITAGTYDKFILSGPETQLVRARHR